MSRGYRVGRAKPFLGRGAGNRRAAIATALAVATLAVGCGIRATTVPVDAGAAPSRVPCAVPVSSASAAGHSVASMSDPASASTTPRLPHSSASSSSVSSPASTGKLWADQTVVYLVCGSKLTAVTRPGELRGTFRSVAEQLLRELQEAVAEREKDEGYSTAVPNSLRIVDPRPDDPVASIRLSTEFTELPPFAFGQLVCTFSLTLAGDASVRLGEPGNKPLHSYSCTDELRLRSEVAPRADAAP